MTLYRYKAIGQDGAFQKGILEAPSIVELKAQLRERDLSLIYYSHRLSFFFSQKMRPRPLMDFCLPFQKGILEAPSIVELKAQLRERDLSLIYYSHRLSFFFSQKMRPRPLMDFCLQLEQFSNAGIPLKESLEELSQVQTSLKLKKILNELIKDIEGGLLFSRALAKHPLVVLVEI